MKNYSPRQLTVKVLFWGLIAFICIGILMPIMAVSMYAFADETTFPRQGGDMIVPPNFGQQGQVFYHFIRIWETERLSIYLVRSLFLAISTVSLSILFATPAAYAFVRYRFPLRKTMFVSIFIFMMLPDVVFGVSLFTMFYKWGILDTKLAVILVHTLRAIPLVTLILNGVFEAIPVTLEEAAFTMGTSRLQAIRKITLPLAAPGVAAASIYAFLLSWDEFVLTSFVGGPSSSNLAVLASRFLIGHDVQHFKASATAIIMLVPVLFVTYFIQRYMKADYLTGGLARNF